MKSMWKGSISFGMVNIPIKMYTTVDRSETVHFKLLYERDHTPIEYRRWSKEHDVEVPWDEVVKGVELDDGSYYVFTKEELDSLRPERSDIIDIVQFVDRESVDDLYYDKHYYLASEKPGQRPYFLLIRALRETGRMAIGRFVLREREYVCAIEPLGDALLLSTLHYEYELRKVEDIEEVKDVPEMKKEEVELAVQLIDHLYEEELDMSEFKDHYAERLKEAIESRDKEHLVTIEETSETTGEEDLVEMLRASLKV
jgi:DNA end-binding protein Ku